MKLTRTRHAEVKNTKPPNQKAQRSRQQELQDVKPERRHHKEAWRPKKKKNPKQLHIEGRIYACKNKVCPVWRAAAHFGQNKQTKTT